MTKPTVARIAATVLGLWVYAVSGHGAQPSAPAPGDPAGMPMRASPAPGATASPRAPTKDARLAARGFSPAPGLDVEVWAAEPMLANPVAFCIDGRGRIYVAETHRLYEGVTDIREHMDWLDEELAAKTSDDLRRLFVRHRHDGHEKNSERITLLQDRTHVGRATHSTVFADKIFNSPVDGIGAGVLARGNNVWYTCIPSLWLLRDGDGDGKTDGHKDVRRPLLTGFGVRVSFLGHDLHGLRIGPDGKLYFSIGDRGASVRTREGKTVTNAEMGVIYRCNQDGTDLEIVHFGLRNPQDLAFDESGNLFTCDNNADGGDPARWVYAAEGGDSGWRIGWQYIESAPWTWRRGPWFGERMCYPEDTSAHIVPPIANISTGPSGLAYYPGTGLGARYDGHFLLCDFRGSPAASGIWSFKVRPRGASFDLVDKEPFVWNMLATDVDFGYDGHVYFSDWVEGWEMTGKGRIYRVRDPVAVKSEAVESVSALAAQDMNVRAVPELERLLTHRDMRVRQEAQFALAEKGPIGLQALARTATTGENPKARVHGIWGLGQLVGTRTGDTRSRAEALRTLRDLLGDREPEVRAQAAKALGDGRDGTAGAALTKLLADPSPRVRHLTAIAIGKLRDPGAVPALLALLVDNADRDAVLRHSAVMGLLGCADAKVIAALVSHPSPSVRLAAVVALRRLEDPRVGAFLADTEGSVVLAAARAISEVPIVPALPVLAVLRPDLAKVSPHQSQPLIRRILGANYRLGDAASAARLGVFAGDPAATEATRAESIDLLADWARPSGRDRITGLWRPLPVRGSGDAIAAAKTVLADALRTGTTPVRLAAVKAARQLEVTGVNPELLELVSNTGADSSARVAALECLARSKGGPLAAALQVAENDAAEPLQAAAMGIRARSGKGGAVVTLVEVIARGTLRRKQAAVAALGAIRGSEADRALGSLVKDLVAGTLPLELQLELLEATDKRKDATVRRGLDTFKAQRKSGDALWPYRSTLAGGNAESGRRIFRERIEASCIRCHKVGSEGGDVGPVLDGIGGKQSREYLLESMVAPNAKVAPGFESLIVEIKDGRNFAGLARPGGPDEVVLQTVEDGVMKFDKGEVAAIQRGGSAMPDNVISPLSRREVRDLVEFLSSLK